MNADPNRCAPGAMKEWNDRLQLAGYYAAVYGAGMQQGGRRLHAFFALPDSATEYAAVVLARWVRTTAPVAVMLPVMAGVE